MISIVFFGSFQQYSANVLDSLYKSGVFKINAVITTPPRPGDRGQITKTPVHDLAEELKLPLFPLEDLESIPSSIEQPDFLVVCGYGKYIPLLWLKFPRILPINAHQSLLPDYAGRFPAQWAILRGESRTGVTLIEMTESFTDKGTILAQESFEILPTETTPALYEKLYNLSANLIIKTLPKISTGDHTTTPQTGKGFYARQLTREDGFVDPKLLSNPVFGITLDRMLRALLPWPGVWTFIKDQNGKKLTLKIFSADISSKNIELKNVQIEGKKMTLWSEIKHHYSLFT